MNYNVLYFQQIFSYEYLYNAHVQQDENVFNFTILIFCISFARLIVVYIIYLLISRINTFIPDKFTHSISDCNKLSISGLFYSNMDLSDHAQILQITFNEYQNEIIQLQRQIIKLYQIFKML